MSVSTSTDRPTAHIASHRHRIDEALSRLATGQIPALLQEPVRYVLEAGGKRMRPIGLLLVAEAFGDDVQRVLPAALAIEVFHNFTLIHDDIMDAAAERRGRPAVHVKWDRETALLTGNLLMGASYDLLGEVESTAAETLYDVYHPMVERLCCGQSLDTVFEEQGAVPVEDYLDMIGGKTGALFAAAFELGGVAAGAPPSAQNQLHTAGLHVGRAFQIQDDLLDLTAESDEWGKAVGGDLMEGKKTFLTLRALERAEGTERRWFARRLQNGGLPADAIPEARDRMARLGVFDDARAAVACYIRRARTQMAVLPDQPASEALHWLLDEMERRSH